MSDDTALISATSPGVVATRSMVAARARGSQDHTEKLPPFMRTGRGSVGVEVEMVAVRRRPVNV